MSSARSSAWRTATNEQKRLRIDELEAERDRLAVALDKLSMRVYHLGGYTKHTSLGDDFYVKREDVLAQIAEAVEGVTYS